MQSRLPPWDWYQCMHRDRIACLPDAHAGKETVMYGYTAQHENVVFQRRSRIVERTVPKKVLEG